MTHDHASAVRYLADCLQPVAEYLLLPELRAARAKAAYVVDLGQCGFQCHGDIVGLTHASLAQVIRPALGDRWLGNGPAVALNVSGCLDLSDECPASVYGILNAVLAHELGHVSMRRPLFTRLVRNRLFAEFHRASINHQSAPTVDEETLIAPDGHDAAFCRVMFHIAERMRRLGLFVPTEYLTWWDGIGVTRPNFVECRLLPEIDTMIGLPLATVAAIGPSREFISTWERA